MSRNGSPHTPPRGDGPPAIPPRPVQSGAKDQTPIPPSSFYGSAPGSSSGSSHAGSAHTTYVPPSTVPSTTTTPTPPHTKTTDPFPEPQLVENASDRTGVGSSTTAQWTEPINWSEPDPWNNPEAGWPGLNLWDADSAARKIAIDGRSEEEEGGWFDAELRRRAGRPGPGMLPPLLAEMMHDPNHTLYSVSVPSPPAATPPHTFAPDADEVRMAVPHPHAYYCREHNGWVLLIVRSSSVLPPLVRETPLPDLARRRKTAKCVGGDQPFGQANMTHHWHRYEKAVDARKINPPYHALNQEEDDDERQLLLDLHVCCQCSMYCLSSDVIPGVIPARLVEDLTRDKMAHPSPERTPKATTLMGWETVSSIIENRLWKGETRVLPVMRSRFQQKIGWSDTIKQIFSAIDFHLEVMHGSTTAEPALQPPEIDSSKRQGKITRKKLLRAWIEVGAWLAIFQKNNDSLGKYDPMVNKVNVDGSAREELQTNIGAHVNQIARGLLPDALVGMNELDESWYTLGMTPTTYSWELLAFAYLAQCRCDPAHTMVYYTHLQTIVLRLHGSGASVPTELQTLLIDERERHRYTPADLREAAAALGFGRENELRMELDPDVDDTFVLEAWHNKRRRSWKDGESAEARKRLDDALRIVADDRGSSELRKAWDEERGTGMGPEQAYSTLEVPKEVDETMLITIYSMRVEDQPSQAEKMREALTVIAEVSESDRLKKFLQTGEDPGEVGTSAAPEMPRGLNQLGNTCYLNSLLQYFYTIRDLREAITPLATVDTKSLDDSKVSDDDLKRHRVGGRLVTRREISRSKRFVNQLADLFWNMEYSETPAVTPTIDLAKLALVTSQDEEEEDQGHDHAGTDSSNDTDATLVEDAPAPPRSTYNRSSGSPVASPDSVLGKRGRDPDAMEVDESQKILASPTAESPAVASSSKLQPLTREPSDVEMKDSQDASQAPPLPPRKSRTVDDSVMMFGRQHDVSECMDNCMFQIETALLDFEDKVTAEDDKTSIVKRMFYGKKKQRLTPLNPATDSRHKSSVHEKEDLFSHLHINVSEDGFDIYDGLSRYFDDVVEFDGHKKRMEVSLVDTPPLLQIQLQRVQFDRETQQAYKSQAYIKFGETIYLDRFLESAGPAKRTRAKSIETELTASRERLQRLSQDKHAPFPPALGGVADFLADQQVVDLPEADSALISPLRDEQAHITALIDSERANAVRLKQQLEDVWKDDTSVAYELTTVFIHRGSSPSWGHYFLYSRFLPDQPDKWFKYNDSDVSLVDKSEVLADTSGSTANPYMLVFAKKGCEAIHTVHRFNPETLREG